MSGSDVKDLQVFLNSAGFIVSKSGAGSPGKETSYFGPATRAAVVSFQKAKGISPAVGYFGPITRSAVKKVACDKGSAGDRSAEMIDGRSEGGYCSVGGKVTGLVASVVLKNNGMDQVTIDPGDDSDFIFFKKIPIGSPYSVTVQSLSVGQRCYLKNAGGVASGAVVSDIEVACGANLSQDPFVPAGGKGPVPITAIGQIHASPKFGTASLAGDLTPSGATAEYQWSIATTSGGVYADIVGATSNSYEPVAGDIGKFLRVSAFGFGNYRGSVTSQASASVAKADAPAAPSAPVLASKTDVSITLAANSSNQFSVDGGANWQDSNVFTSLSAGDSYSFVSRVKETATTSPSAASAATLISTYESFVSIGGISGTPKAGVVLTAGALTPAGATVSYQWRIATSSDGAYSNIVGATSATYTPVAADASKFIKVVATGMGDYYGSSTSSAVGPVAALVVGDSYQGGKVAYILAPGDSGYDAGTQHGFIAAASDQSAGATWGCYGAFIVGADGSSIGTGEQNTIDIMAGCSSPGIAARICGNLSLNGYSDWYLPSVDELNQMRLNRVAIGGFEDAYYMSSTEVSDTGAWRQDFTDGTLQSEDKIDTARVRAIRSF